MTVRTFGVEEEFLLVDPRSGHPVEGSEGLLWAVYGGRDGHHRAEQIDRELLRDQIESRTEPCTTVAEALDQLVESRRLVGTAARRAGVAVIASGTTPHRVSGIRVSPKERYRDMVETFGDIGRDAGTCGMHVHVGVDSDEEGVAVIDGLRPWLPLLLALSVNSPYDGGHDTDYASWRSRVWARWPTAGPTDAFGSVAGYREATRRLLQTGAAMDAGMLYFDARLADSFPTVEIRVADVCTDPRDALVVAALARALVETLALREPDPDPWRTELVRAAHWRAARFGLSSTLVDPLAVELRPAHQVMETLVATVTPALCQSGDLEFVTEGIGRLLQATGADRQRAAFERTGSIDGVVADLVERTEAAWGGC